MLRLLEVNEENWLAVRRLSVRKEQEGFLDSALGILARGYVYRAERARVIAVAEEDTILGLALVKDLDEEPACYDLQQFFIDRAYQGRGYGTAALGLILEELGLTPVIHADLALGEGTGAVLLKPLLDMALRVYHGPHTFDELGIKAYTAQEGVS